MIADLNHIAKYLVEIDKDSTLSIDKTILLISGGPFHSPITFELPNVQAAIRVVNDFRLAVSEEFRIEVVVTVRMETDAPTSVPVPKGGGNG